MTPDPAESHVLPRPLGDGIGASPRTVVAVVRDVVALTKPRLTGLVVFTTGVGILLAPGALGFFQAWWAIGLTMLVVAGATSLNMYLERDVDRFMERTRDRPLPAGRLAPRTAVVLGITLPAFALPALALTVNGVTALLGAVALVLYVAVYTPLKRRSPVAVHVGAIPGAIPIVMGWTAVTGRIDAGAWILFGILAFWQIPHFLAIALYRREEYQAARIRVMPLVHGDRVTRWHMLAGAAGLAAATLAPTFAGLGNTAYAVLAIVVAVATLGATIRGLMPGANAAWARRYFLATLLYLPVMLGALVLTTLP